MEKKKLFCFFLLFCACFLFPFSVKAGDLDNKPKVTMINGDVVWTTEDKKATAPITWRTEGYTVKNYKVLTSKASSKGEYGAPRAKKPYGGFVNKQEYSHIVGEDSGIYTVRWTIPKDVVKAQCKNAGVSAKTLEEEGGYLYLNGFFRTYHYGKVFSNYIYDLNTITHAASWESPDDFKDHFDIPVKFDSEPQPVKITFRELSDYKMYDLKTRDCNDKKALSYFVPKDSTISLATLFPENQTSKINVGKKLWAYRVHLENIETGKTIRNSKIVLKNNPLTAHAAYAKELNDFRNSKWEVPYGGLRVVVGYRSWKETLPPPLKPDEPNTKTMSDDFTDPQPPNNKLEGVIKADKKGNELFDVEDGIPTTEKLYSYVIGQEYLVSYTFTNYSGTKQYQQVIPSGSPLVPPTITTVSRNYSYWKITQLDVYQIDRAKVSNYALPDELITLKPSDAYKKPLVEVKQNSGMKEPASGVSSVGQIKVQNDFLSINGKVLMKDGWFEASTPTPTRLKRPSVVNDEILFKQAMTIERNKENGEWDSEGTLFYKNVKSIGESQGEELDFDLEINSVVIHTPTVCDARVQDVKEFNQMIHPDKSCAGLVLDRTFKVNLPTVGVHNDYKNYGYRDYAKYIARREVRFPFDTFKDSTYIPANTWTKVQEDYTSFYLPPWVNEGYYMVEFKSTAINSDANQGSNSQEELANYDLNNYVATDIVTVQVSGRLYGLNIYDITDYPLWKDFFRKKDSTKTTGNNYKVGTKDRNGESNKQNPKFTLPLISGSHPTVKCQGVIPTGYFTRFSLYTIGNMYDGKDDYIRMIPRFYYVSKDGKTREEVDLWYDETFDGEMQYLVKVGSKKDKRNQKTMKLGNVYTSVPKKQLVNTAKILGITENALRSSRSNVYSFSQILLPWSQRTFIGEITKRPSAISDSKVRRSVQKWYGEYYIPSKVHAVKKGTDVIEYAHRYGIDYHESFWKKDGYIMVNFDIETIKDKERHLSYINAANASDGYCNMWKLEGFQYSKKDCKDHTFTFKSGDYALFDLNRSVSDDYQTGGTH